MRTNQPVLFLLGAVVASCGGPAASVTAPAAEVTPEIKSPTPVVPSGCGTGAIASNAGGASVTVASNEWNGSAWVLEICATTDGVHWVGPTEVGEGTHPSAAVGPDGRAVLVWANEIASTGAQSVQWSAMSPGGSWSSAAVLDDSPGDPSIVMDGAGNALVMWATEGSDDDSAVQSSTLAANGTQWTQPVILAPAGGLVKLVGNAAGEVLVTFRTRTTNDIQVASGTVLGGLGTPVTLGITGGYVRENVAPVPAINGDGQAVVAWESTYNGSQYATRTASGTWSSARQLAYPETAVTVAVDSAGNFILTWANSAGAVQTLTIPG